MNRTTHIRAAKPGMCGLIVHFARQGDRHRRAFSLLELIIVISVALILTSLLLPALNSVRENVNSVVCASNLRQINLGLTLYAADHHDRLPSSIMLDKNNNVWRPQELMGSRHPQKDAGWDGIGLLFELDYCRDAACFYCPSHTGEHPYERYKTDWSDLSGTSTIYTNYHYSGPYSWDTKLPRFLHWRRASEMILATDGLRTASDFNHDRGLNAAYGDGSVRWRSDVARIRSVLPAKGSPIYGERYNSIWDELESPLRPPASPPK